MINLGKSKKLLTIASLAAALVSSIALSAWAHDEGKENRSRDDRNNEFFTKLYTPKPSADAVKQVLQVSHAHEVRNARLIARMLSTPQAVWFTAGSPKTVKKAVRTTVEEATEQERIPVLVAYNIPFRDCSQYSAGGATSVAEYKAWIDGFAAGLGNSQAIVILEPDGLGIIPHYTTIDGFQDWCKPAEADPKTVVAERFAMMNYAVDTLKARPNVSVYLDGVHSGWLNVGDISDRLVKAGVQRADGFFLNTSNYQYTANLTQYGNWISNCIAYATTVNPGGFKECPHQYWNGGPLPSVVAQLFGEWNGVGLSAFGVWSDDATDQTLNTSGINQRYASMLGAVKPTTHFVMDTSRNGQGPWKPTAIYPDAQDWCNPPGRGLGKAPTLNTGVALVDAYLWIKKPGESDGACSRGLGMGNTTVDPEWKMVDPAAGAWFPNMALELVQKAVQ